MEVGKSGQEGGERTERPWGWFETLSLADGYRVKRILVRPGQRLSYQSHAKRAERWIVVAGIAHVTLDDLEFNHHIHDVVEVGVQVKHRIANQGTDDLVVIEVQLGSYLGEDDITRYQDDYGRNTGTATGSKTT